MPALPLPAAAVELGISEPTLRRWMRQGAPVTRQGGRGRGRAALIDPVAVAAWRAPGKAAGIDAQVFAAELPELLAAAVWSTFVTISGPHKRPAAGELAAAWYAMTTAALDRLREHDAAVPELSALPEAIDRLQKIAHR
ncbi:MAG: terminase small subunit [Gammaproteobacteria bacterium]|nr:terminase small subunit [Gammaproteobacteria bacterium]